MSDPIWYGIDLARNDTASGMVMLMHAGAERVRRIEAPFREAIAALQQRLTARLHHWLQTSCAAPPRRCHRPHGSLRQRKRMVQKRKR
jgi:hypothetical protein